MESDHGTLTAATERTYAAQPWEENGLRWRESGQWGRASRVTALLLVCCVAVLVAVLSPSALGQPSKARAKAKPKLSLVLDPTVVAPGGRLEISVRNRSREMFSTGVDFRVQFFRNGAWERIPAGPFKKLRVFVKPQSTKQLSLYYIPFEAEAGSYRIRKDVGGVKMRAAYSVSGP
jgi:hypothetical protein